MARFNNAYLPSGFKFPRYVIERILSRGGFGAVYLAKRDDGKSVAIKEFLPSMLKCRKEEDNGRVTFASVEDAKKFKAGLSSFFQEADTVKKIQNKQIVEILDVFEANSTAYFAMPVEQGCSLQAFVSQRGRLSDELIRKIFIDAATGLKVLHDHGLLHLDIKPGNLWIRPDNSLVILDLGASRSKHNYHLLAPPARTPGYAAPEQHMKKNAIKKPLGIQTDTYGLAATMYACIEGSAPPESIKRKESDMPYSLQRKGQVSDGLLEIIDQGLSLRVERRIQSAEDFRKKLLMLPQLPDVSFYGLNLNRNSPGLLPIK